MRNKFRAAALESAAAIGSRSDEGFNLRRESANDYPHLNEQQLATRWGISPKKLQADRLKGTGIPFIKLGRAVRYRHADVMAWEERHLHASTTTVVDADRVK